MHHHGKSTWNKYNIMSIPQFLSNFAVYIQIAELTRLSQTLMQVPNIHWIIGEDNSIVSPQLQEFVDNLQVPHTLLLSESHVMVIVM